MGIPYETKKKAKRRYFANYMDCKDAKISTDCISNAAIIYGQSVTPLEKRLKARICELVAQRKANVTESTISIN